MNDYIFGCPECQREFRVLVEYAGEIVQCPHCSQETMIPADFYSAEDTPSEASKTALDVDQIPSEFPSVSPKSAGFQPIEIDFGAHQSAPTPTTRQNYAETPVQPPPKFPNETNFEDPLPKAKPDEPNPLPMSAVSTEAIGHLMPPKFVALDPTKIRNRIQADTKVFLPTADGGVQTVDDRLVTIEYKGQKYTVVALTAVEKRRRQIIVNVISLLIAIGAIAGTIWLLLN